MAHRVPRVPISVKSRTTVEGKRTTGVVQTVREPGREEGCACFQRPLQPHYGHTMECEPELFNGTTGMALST